MATAASRSIADIAAQHAAERAHEVRDDLKLEQILDMVIAVATIHGDPEYVEPILRATLGGLVATL